ncbi:PIN domain-containing protein [Gloeobacter violaceus]|uniref:Gll2300 protein n=1 Tax=Gloeobacter violaceus (strain ATCC 29082 / PCC 7421) TaxID=251221 RepID=Q7NI83_GLOVI|nr:PIN domain-containing protein [Gloeobacter violaceus]BAC90241.1 gll2300 [Gloeobacter violaceus PCC 7421]
MAVVVLYDTNVLLDIVLVRQPYYRDSLLAVDAASSERISGYIAGHAPTTLFYVLKKQVGAPQARRSIAHLLAHLTVAAVDDAGIRGALVSPFEDFKDAVTAMAAVGVNAQFVCTRDLKDYAASPVRAILPAVLLASV